MAALDPAPAIAAAAHGHVKLPHHGAADDVFLILAQGAEKLHFALAVLAPRRQLDGDLLIDTFGNGAPAVLAIVFPRLAARPFWLRFQFPSGMGRRLALGGPQRLLQQPAQPLDFFAQPRSEWDPETLNEQRYDVSKTLRLFDEANR